MRHGYIQVALIANHTSSYSNSMLIIYEYEGATLSNLLPFGRIIGCVTMTGIMDKLDYERSYNRSDCAFQNAWICTNPRILVEPVIFSGRQSICECSLDVAT